MINRGTRNTRKQRGTAVNKTFFKYLFIAGFIIMLTGSNTAVQAGTLVFGPEDFVRGPGKPETVSKTFSVNQPPGTFWLQISNGSSGQKLVSSALIWLNGEQVVGPEDFNQQVFAFTKDVRLQAVNTLQVEVRGIPGSFLTVEIRTADPNPTVTNRKRDFSGLNNGDFVALWWEQDERASEYVISRAFASDGPWEELARVPLSSGTDFTSEAKLKQLCYRIEALNASGNVIRSYEPICIPIFVETTAPTTRHAAGELKDYHENSTVVTQSSCPVDIIFGAQLPNSIVRTFTAPTGGADAEISARDCCIRDDVVEIYVDNCLLAKVDSRGGDFGTHPGETHTVSVAPGMHTVEYRNVISDTGPSGWQVCETIKPFTGKFQCDKPYNTMCFSDQQFTDNSAMTLDQIRKLLADKNSFLRGQIHDVDGTVIDPAQIIFDAAQTHHINPEVILTTLQKEQGSVTAKDPLSKDRLSLIMGFGKATTIRDQIKDATGQFRRDFDRLSNNKPTAGGWQVDVPKKSLDPLEVTPANKGVAVLFSYTPWVGQGWGGRKLIGGNFLFCDIWKKFGFSQ